MVNFQVKFKIKMRFYLTLDIRLLTLFLAFDLNLLFIY